MSNWDIPGIPHKGWILIDVIDIRDEGESEDETVYETCMMCGNEKIRYVHIVEHPDIEEDYKVGCVCAEKMTSDYVNPKYRENQLRNKTNRRVNWLKRKWKTSNKDNKYLNLDGHNIGFVYDAKSNSYKCRIDSNFGSLRYPDLEKAKIGLFNKVEELKSKGRW